jgi:ABC-type multidrug transport system ATPase subunit
MACTLEVDSVFLEFGNRRILSDIYMLFEEGKVTSILGRNGAGKSCLLKIILGSEKAQYASVRFNGKPLHPAFNSGEKVRYMPQFNIFPGYLKLSKILSIYGCAPGNLEADFLEFSGHTDQPFSRLSSGQKRLFETWLFLKIKSKFILLDEPFSYLMPLHVEKLKEIIGEEKKNKGIVITDHLYRDLVDISDSVYLIYDLTAKKIRDHAELKEFGYIN